MCLKKLAGYARALANLGRTEFIREGCISGDTQATYAPSPSRTSSLLPVQRPCANPVGPNSFGRAAFQAIHRLRMYHPPREQVRSYRSSVHAPTSVGPNLFGRTACQAIHSLRMHHPPREQVRSYRSGVHAPALLGPNLFGRAVCQAIHKLRMYRRLANKFAPTAAK